MGCNCKKVEKLEVALAPNANDNEVKKKGIKNILKWVGGFLWKLLLYLLIMICVCVIVPCVLSIVIFNALFKGEAYIKIPSAWLKTLSEGAKLSE